ncbi:leukotriene A-4 hydrolase-like [Temnothorax nylanderi]|uniref:leukotriene A-4 hydrolase-like n=1 Tax=Temnothorax nylanderi TaxID=102681 RepID=UPI003A8AAA62
MDCSSFRKDPHSFALPELARVIHTDLELMVDFDRRVLKGKAILTITRQPSINQIILDNLGLDIGRVTNALDGTHLHRHIGINSALGNAIHVDLPSIIGTDNPDCKIEIEYETNPQSEALYWLTPAPTVYGSHPFLLSNNKLIYARSWFPCQDTPSVKFTYSATIWVRKPYTVLMSALSQCIHKDPELNVYVFRQKKPIPSYAVVIAVGSLWARECNKKISIFAEENTFQSHVNKFRYTAIEEMLRYAENNLCGPYTWDKYDICVLPPSIAHFEIECPCVTFISSTLLGGDLSYIGYSLARNISQSWAGNLVTCENYEHLWLNKSFSLFISRKIKREMLHHENIDVFLQREGANNLDSLVREPAYVALPRCLLPNFQFTSELPHTITKYVPYERGYFLLCYLENILGGRTVFNPFLIAYFRKFADASINTKDWKDYLYKYFSNKKKMLDGVNWHFWFGDTSSSLNLPHLSQLSLWEHMCFSIVKKWISWDNRVHDVPPPVTADDRNLCNVQKIILLNDLHSFHRELTIEKLDRIYNHFFRDTRDTRNGKIRLLWLLLCIKVRWADKVGLALNFAIEHCSPNYACPIFQHLYEWEEKREEVIDAYNRNKGKMLNETREQIDQILHQNL